MPRIESQYILNFGNLFRLPIMICNPIRTCFMFRGWSNISRILKSIHVSVLDHFFKNRIIQISFEIFYRQMNPIIIFFVVNIFLKVRKIIKQILYTVGVTLLLLGKIGGLKSGASPDIISHISSKVELELKF